MRVSLKAGSSCYSSPIVPQRRFHLCLWMMSLVMICVSWGCTPTFVKGTEIDYTPEKQEVADFIERYRQAIEQRDFNTLKDMVSSNYYENGSTTSDPSDDYDFAGFLKILNDMSQTIKAVKYTIKINNIEVMKSSAAVDLEYSGQYLFTHHEQDRWETYADKNRITLGKNKLGHWKIMSGL